MPVGQIYGQVTQDAWLPVRVNADGELMVNLEGATLTIGKVDQGDAGDEPWLVDVTSIAAGTNNIGDVDVVSSALPAGAATETTLAAIKALLDGSTITSQTFTIANAASLSDAFDLAGKAILRLSMPAAWTAAVLTFQTSFDNSTWYDMYDQYGTEISLTVAASRSIAVDVSIFTAMRFVRLRSGTAAAAVNQGAQRLVVATVKAL